MDETKMMGMMKEMSTMMDEMKSKMEGMISMMGGTDKIDNSKSIDELDKNSKHLMPKEEE